jgi:rare lipoprotein A
MLPQEDRPVRRHGTRAAACLIAATALAGAPSPGLHAESRADVTAIATTAGRGTSRGVQEGLVSWYGAAFHDRPTASGERFDATDMTMAHPTLPFGTPVRVTNLRNGRSVVVRVNDRGPHVAARIADLSRAAAVELGMLRRGVVRARIEVLDPGDQASRGNVLANIDGSATVAGQSTAVVITAAETNRGR